MALLLSGCSQGETVRNGRDCFPKEAARWITSSQADDGFAGRKDSTGAVTVYVDGSGSMAGYLNGATEAERPFQDLISSIGDSFSTSGAPVAFKAFGSKLRDVPAAERARLTRAGFFTCQGAAPGDCDNGETRLDLVLNDIVGRKDELSIVVTDMWFSDPSSPTSGLVPLAAPVEKILSSGRAIAAYGIPAPYAGTIYDLPGGGRIAFTGRRPLMLLVIGPNDRVRDLHDKLKRFPSKAIARDMTSGAIRRAVFTLDPSAGIVPQQAPLSPSRDPRVRPGNVLDAVKGVKLQQFVVKRGDARGAPPRGATGPHWQGPSDESFMESAVWTGPLRVRSQVWENRGETCGAAQWLGPTRIDAGWQVGDEGGRQTYRLDPADLLKDLPRPGTYLITGEVARVSLEQPNPASAWMREWSFGADEGTGGAEGGRFYRTLNLSEFARLMENALAQAAERKPGPITGFTYVVQIAD